MGELSETKEKIFDVFVEMASTLGYENVTTRDIAKRIGINAASIYYHFESKEKILEFAYEYYEKYQYDNRRSVDEMKEIVETENAEDIVSKFFYSFVTEDHKKYVRMILITKIIYMRIFQDKIANAMFTDSNANNIEYIVSILKHGVEIGRVDPAFDLETFADVTVGAISFMGIKAFADEGYAVGQLNHEKNILAQLSRLLSTALI